MGSSLSKGGITESFPVKMPALPVMRGVPRAISDSTEDTAPNHMYYYNT